MLKFLSSHLKCCANIVQGRQRKTSINLIMFAFLLIHLWWHLYAKVSFEGCTNVESDEAVSDSVGVMESCRHETKKPVLGCTTNNKKILYKDDVRVLGTGLPKKVFLTIGIPSIQRMHNNKTVSYLEMTLDSLIENLSPKELSEVHIVVFLADFKKKAREKIRSTVSSKYRKYVDNNFINVVQAPREFYPQLTSLPRTYGDSPNRVFWRSKQNMDYAFLFKYCENLSDYYMQLEDDVTTTNGYLTVIKNCVKQYEYTRWAFIQTVGWGFVGKLFKNAELDYFARMLRLFYNDMPCDWLIYNFNRWRGVNSTSPSLRVCGNIFFHKGKQSSRLSSLRNTM